MKLIIAVVQPFMASDVVHALHSMPGITGATFTDVRGFGRARRRGERGGEVVTDEASKVRLEIVVRDAQADAVARAIRKAARTGNRGDGKIFVLPVEQALRIASDDEGDAIV